MLLQTNLSYIKCVCYCYLIFQGVYFRKKYWELDSSWNVMAHGDARQGEWRGNWRMQWVASTLHTTSEHGVSSITTADAHTSAASSRLNWRPRRFQWTRKFCQKTKSGFCACAITFQLASKNNSTCIIKVCGFSLCRTHEVIRRKYSLNLHRKCSWHHWKWQMPTVRNFYRNYNVLTSI